MPLVDDYKTRLAIVSDRSTSAERRIFAALELVCMPASFLTIIALVAFIPVNRAGLNRLPAWFNTLLFPVLVSAAIGYLTNWVAIEMLFKPYRRTVRHPFAWMTFGYWRQGLVPRNKGQIASAMGSQVASRLLQPEKLAGDLCGMVGEALQDKAALSSMQGALQRLVAAHDREIAAFLVPRVESALVGEIDRLVTAESVGAFWQGQVEPRLRRKETREEVARVLVAALEKRAPAITAVIRPKIIAAIEGYVGERGGMVGAILAPLAGSLADALIDGKTVEKALREWLGDPETTPALRDGLLDFVQSFRDYLQSPEAQGRVDGFAGEIRQRFKDYLRGYLETNLAPMAGSVLRSDSLWRWVASLIPQMRPELEAIIRGKGMPLIIGKMDIKGRTRAAVDKMDVEEFHGMVNEIAAEHLGAIQVLGYILGAVAGGLLLLAR